MTDPVRPVAPREDVDKGKEYPRLKGRCPSCHSESLFRGYNGYITCSVIGCKEPAAAHDLLAAAPVPCVARFDLLDDPQRGLHAVLTRFGIASRSDAAALVTALVHWAADAYRSSQPAVPCAAQQESEECADSELLHYAKAAVSRNGKETPAIVVKWLAQAFVRLALVPCAASPADPWQPIETAPQDWSWFLAWSADLEFLVYRSGPGLIAAEEPDPTHWMPLPSPPRATGEGARDEPADLASLEDQPR